MKCIGRCTLLPQCGRGAANGNRCHTHTQVHKHNLECDVVDQCQGCAKEDSLEYHIIQYKLAHKEQP